MQGSGRRIGLDSEIDRGYTPPLNTRLHSPGGASSRLLRTCPRTARRGSRALSPGWGREHVPARRQTNGRPFRRPALGAGGPDLSGPAVAGAGALEGSTPAAPKAGRGGQVPPKSYMNKSVFDLPVHIDERARGGLQEIDLYVKDNPAAPWTLHKKERPTATVFPFQPPRDGEYWFTVVTVDRVGRQMPPDV